MSTATDVGDSCIYTIDIQPFSVPSEWSCSKGLVSGEPENDVCSNDQISKLPFNTTVQDLLGGCSKIAKFAVFYYLTSAAWPSYMSSLVNIACALLKVN